MTMMIFEGGTLFEGPFIRDWYKRQLDQAEEIVYSINTDQFAVSTDDQITDYVLDQLAVQPIELHRDKRAMARPVEAGAMMQDFGRTVRVPALRFTVSIPFTGDAELWTVGHSPFQSIYPKGGVAPTSQDGVGLLQLQVLQKSLDQLLWHL